MRRIAALTIVASLVSAGMVFANAGPPRLPKGRKVAEPPVRFTGIDNKSDYVFYIHYGATYFEDTLAEVKDSEPIKLNFKTKDFAPNAYMVLLAMERKDFEKRKKDDPSLKWLKVVKDGVLTAKLTPPPTTLPVDAKEPSVTTYRVTLKEDKLNVEKVEEKKSEPSSFLPWWTFGLAVSVSISWLGIWFARRSVLAKVR
jgi:hypothetical protein